MKNKKLFALILSAILVLTLIPASIFAEPALPEPEEWLSEWGSFVNPQSPNTFYLTEKDINSFADLKPLVEYSGNRTIDTIIILTNVKTNDLSSLQHLGSSLSGDDIRIPKIDSSSSNIASGYPVRILPAYDPAGTGQSKFAPSYNVRANSGHTILQNYLWDGDVEYIYDNTRNNSVKIEHQVVDENGTLMLQYADSSLSTANVSRDEQFIYINGINTPDVSSTLYDAYFEYDGPIWARTSLGDGRLGSYFKINQSYRYNIAARFLSAINIDLPVAYIGQIEITKINPDNEPLPGAVFKIYTDAECTEEATKIDPATGERVPIGEVTTGADGKAVVFGLTDNVYYAKEIKAPKGYLVNEEAVKLPVIGQYGNFHLDFAGGEGNTVTINKELVSFTPDWTGNAAGDTPLDLIPSEDSTETKSAVQYGKDTFFRGGGQPVAFNDPNAAALVDQYATNAPTYTLEVGSISRTFSSLASLLAYVNDELIGNSVIDSAQARDLVNVTCSEDIVYIPYQSTAASVTVVDQYIPVDVTINKSWKNDSPAQRGEFLLVQLMQDGKAYGEPVELNEGNNWSWTWENLPGGHTYTVDEPDIPENYIMSKTEETEETDERIYITVNMTNEYVSGSADTFDNAGRLLLMAGAMILVIFVLRRKISSTPTK